MDGEANLLSFNKRFCVLNREASLVKLTKKIAILLYGINCHVQCLDTLILPACGGILNAHIGSYNLLKRCNFNRRLLLLHNRFRNCFISRFAFMSSLSWMSLLESSTVCLPSIYSGKSAGLSPAKGVYPPLGLSLSSWLKVESFNCWSIWPSSGARSIRKLRVYVEHLKLSNTLSISALLPPCCH